VSPSSADKENVMAIVELRDRPAVMSGPAMDVESTGGPKDQWDDKVLTRMREGMAACDLDALLVVRGENVCWLTHWWDEGQMSLMPEEENAWIVIPAEGEPFGVGTGAISWGMELPCRPHWLKKLYGFSMATFPDEAASLAGLLKDKRLAAGRIGIETGWLPHDCFVRFQELLPEARFAASDAILYQARSAKSPFELAVIKEGIALFDAAFTAARDDLRRHKDVFRAMRVMHTEIAAGGGLPMIVPTQQHGYHWLGADSPDYRKLLSQWYHPKTYDAENEIIRGDFCIKYQGYWVDRSLYQWVNPDKSRPRVGEIEALYQRLYDKQQLLCQAVKAGMTGKESYEAIRRLQSQRGTDFLFWFHGVGLSLHDEPAVGPQHRPRDDVSWEIGSVAASEVFDEGVLFEDMFVLTEAGWQPLTQQPPFIYEP